MSGNPRTPRPEGPLLRPPQLMPMGLGGYGSGGLPMPSGAEGIDPSGPEEITGARKPGRERRPAPAAQYALQAIQHVPQAFFVHPKHGTAMRFAFDRDDAANWTA